MQLQLRLWFALFFLGLFTATTFVSPSSFAYDGLSQTLASEVESSSFGYDGTAVLPACEKPGEVAGEHTNFGRFAEFLAAERGLLSTTSGEAMESGLFQRIQSAFQRNGGVMQADAESTRLLNSLGAEGATLDSSTILLRQNPGTLAVYEELIHSAQLRRGMTDATRMEIEAAEKLIRFRQGYRIPNAETSQTIERLRQLRGGQ